MKDWKTTIPGVLAGLVLVVKTIFPQYSGLCDVVAAALIAVLGIFAAQAK